MVKLIARFRSFGKNSAFVEELEQRLKEAERILVELDDLTVKRVIPLSTPAVHARDYLMKHYGEKK